MGDCNIHLNFSVNQPSAHLDVRDIFGETCLPGTVGTVAAKTAYGFVKGYERDYGKFTVRLTSSQGAASVKQLTVKQGIVGI